MRLSKELESPRSRREVDLDVEISSARLSEIAAQSSVAELYDSATAGMRSMNLSEFDIEHGMDVE